MQGFGICQLFAVHLHAPSLSCWIGSSRLSCRKATNTIMAAAPMLRGPGLAGILRSRWARAAALTL